MLSIFLQNFSEKTYGFNRGRMSIRSKDRRGAAIKRDYLSCKIYLRMLYYIRRHAYTDRHGFRWDKRRRRILCAANAIKTS